MKRPICFIDHVANPGGGVKYVLQLLDGLRAHWDMRLYGHPAALARYRHAARGTQIALCKVWPTNPVPALVQEWPILARGLSFFQQSHLSWTFGVRSLSPDSSRIHVFPWLHRHDLSQFAGRGIGVFHDAIFFQMPELIGPLRLGMESANLRTWFAKLDRVVVTSRHTRDRLIDLAGAKHESMIEVIPVADTDGTTSPALGGEQATRRFGSYLVMPSNTSPHKNHRALFEAMSRSQGKWNLVLTGEGTESGGETTVGRLAREFGLQERTFGLGYVEKALVTSLIAGAEALVMPSMAEGGGSFPVCEAIAAGTPVIASNIDVIQEQLARMGAQATVFAPRDVGALVAALDRLAGNRAELRRAARDQVGRLHLRTWTEVARDFDALLQEIYPGRQSP